MIKEIFWTATIAAVSVLNLVLPSVMGIKPDFIPFDISLKEKSPSGPIKIVADSLGFIQVFKLLFSLFSQCAIYTVFLCSFFKKSPNEITLFNLGNWNFRDCFVAARIIFSNRSGFINFLSELSHIMGVISSIPISVAFSKNHSNLSLFFNGEITTWR